MPSVLDFANDTGHLGHQRGSRSMVGVFVKRFGIAMEQALHIFFVRHELGYGPAVPIEPRDEVADLISRFNESVSTQAELVERIEKAASRIQLVGRAA